MRKILSIILICLLASGAFAASKIVELDFVSSNPSLTDKRGNLTAGAVSRVSAATYIDADGVLQTAWGDRDQLVNTAAQNDLTTWWIHYQAGNTVADGIVADTNSNLHYIRNSGSPFTANRTYVLSGSFKKGDVDWVGLFWKTAVNKGVYFDLENGVVGSTDGSIVADIVSEGDGWYRCSMAFTADAPAALVFVYPAEADGDVSFAGDDSTVSTYIRNIMIEELPSGNVIGDDLVDQETLGSDIARTWAINAGSPTIDGDEITFADETSSVKDLTYWTIGKIYKVNVTISEYSGSGSITLLYDGGGTGGTSTDIYGASISKSANGTYEFYYKPSGSTTVWIYSQAGHTAVVTVNSIQEMTAPYKGTLAWPYLQGAEAITLTNDQTFVDENVGNWTLQNDSTDSTLTYSPADKGGVDDKQMLITVDETTDPASYAYARLTTSASGGGGDVILTPNTLHRVSESVQVPVGNAIKSVVISWPNVGGTIPSGINQALGNDTYETASGYFYFGIDVVGFFRTGFNGNPNDGDLMYIDDISVRPIQFSWTPFDGNEMELDSDGLHITWVDHANGAVLNLNSAADLTDDLVVGQRYLLRLDTKVGAGDTVFYRVYNGAININGGFIAESFTTYELIFTAQHTTGNTLYFGGFGEDDDVWIRSYSIQAIPPLALLQPSDYVNSATIPAKPRFESDGLLGEGEATNLLEYSEDWSQWIGTNVKSPGDSTIDPRGETNTALGLIADATATEARSNVIIYSNVLKDNTIYTGSVFVKAGSVDWVQLWLERKDDVGANRYFNLSGTGLEGTAVSIEDSGIEYIGGGWYKCWISIDTTTGTKGPYFRIWAADSDTGQTFAANEDDVLIYIYGAQFEESPYPTSYIPTDGSQVTRTSEAGDGTYGYQWTMSATLKNILSDALPGGGATPSIGTLIVEWTAGQDYDAVDTGSRGLVAVRDADKSIAYFANTEGKIASYDATGGPLLTISHSAGDEMISVVRFDSTADSGSGYLHIVNKKNSTWGLNVGNESAYDGGFTLGTYFWLFYGNELPIRISRIIIYDWYLQDSHLQVELWNKRVKGVNQMGMNVR